MKGLFSRIILVAAISLAFVLLLPPTFVTSVTGLVPLGVIVAGLLGSGVLGLFLPLERAPDRGFFVGLVWGALGAMVSTWIFGTAVWDKPAMSGASQIAAYAHQGGAAAPALTAPFGTVLLATVFNTAIMAVGMVILAAPVLLAIGVAQRSGRRRPPT